MSNNLLQPLQFQTLGGRHPWLGPAASVRGSEGSGTAAPLVKSPVGGGAASPPRAPSGSTPASRQAATHGTGGGRAQTPAGRAVPEPAPRRRRRSPFSFLNKDMDRAQLAEAGSGRKLRGTGPGHPRVRSEPRRGAAGSVTPTPRRPWTQTATPAPGTPVTPTTLIPQSPRDPAQRPQRLSFLRARGDPRPRETASPACDPRPGHPHPSAPPATPVPATLIPQNPPATPAPWGPRAPLARRSPRAPRPAPVSPGNASRRRRCRTAGPGGD